VLPQRPDCVAGVVRFELRNVVVNYPFERSYRFAGDPAEFWHRDYARLSAVGHTQLEPNLGPGAQAGLLPFSHGRLISFGRSTLPTVL
jgi:hypothetical protein